MWRRDARRGYRFPRRIALKTRGVIGRVDARQCPGNKWISNLPLLSLGKKSLKCGENRTEEIRAGFLNSWVSLPSFTQPARFASGNAGCGQLPMFVCRSKYPFPFLPFLFRGFGNHDSTTFYSLFLFPIVYCSFGEADA